GQQLEGVAARLLGGVPRGKALGRALLAAGEVDRCRREGGVRGGGIRPALALGLGAGGDGVGPAFVPGVGGRAGPAGRGGGVAACWWASCQRLTAASACSPSASASSSSARYFARSGAGSASRRWSRVLAAETNPGAAIASAGLPPRPAGQRRRPRGSGSQ